MGFAKHKTDNHPTQGPNLYNCFSWLKMNPFPESACRIQCRRNHSQSHDASRHTTFQNALFSTPAWPAELRSHPARNHNSNQTPTKPTTPAQTPNF